jgi:hemerythrin-like domain-containing protein
MAQATQILRQEHESILKMLDAAEQAAIRIEGGGRVRRETLSGVSEFFRLFADLCHHAKEEDILFPWLESHGMPRAGGPTGVMMHEHVEGRAFVRRMAEASEACNWGEDSQKNWAEAARGYIALLRQHIFKENNILFVMAENMLSPEEQESLAGKFAAAEVEKLGPGAREKLEGMMNDLLAELAAP